MSTFFNLLLFIGVFCAILYVAALGDRRRAPGDSADQKSSQKVA